MTLTPLLGACNGKPHTAAEGNGPQTERADDSRGGFEEALLDYDLKYDMSDLIHKHNIDIGQHKEAAMEAIKFWISLDFFVENSKGGTLMASRAKEVREALGSKSPFPDKNWKAVTYYPFAPLAATTNVDSKARSIYEKHLNALLAGTVDLHTGLRMMAEETQKMIDEQPK
ncbi:hypothetical protein [Paenibacillus ginsengarvi]|uniref:hypothetical protein n=1 Tax=Paenibacillus ginsengarvi TaxID=400777 RepID=UPI001961107F|nr:hypothetical protein [Paenibacillus ginsengarvi]